MINNAGIIKDAPFGDMTPDRLDPVLDVHVKGAFNVTRPAWSTMLSQGYGRIVNTTSTAGLIGHRGQTNYGTAKAGLIGLTRILALEGDNCGIKVNAIAPTAVTRMLERAMSEPGRPDDAAALHAFKTLMNQLDPDLVSPVVAFLAHESCPVSGEVFTAGGGQVSRFFIARTKGFYKSELSLEDVDEHFAQICDESDYTVPTDAGDETTLFIQERQRDHLPASSPDG